MPTGIYERTEETRKKISIARIKRKERLGYINSFKTRKKISELNKGKKHTLETKRKMSGKIPWNKGLTKEIDERIRKYSELIKGKQKSEIHKINLSISQKGHKHTEETLQKKSKAMSGKNNHQWLGGKSFEPYDQSFNRRFKKLIRKRDNNVCILCGIFKGKLKKELAVHHIDYDKLNSIQENCVSLCNNCHSKTNKNRKYWTKFFQDLLKENYGYKY